MGAWSSSRLGCWRKISRDTTQSCRISSESCTRLPGQAEWTSRSRLMTPSNTSGAAPFPPPQNTTKTYKATSFGSPREEEDEGPPTDAAAAGDRPEIGRRSELGRGTGGGKPRRRRGGYKWELENMEALLGILATTGPIWI